MELGEKKKKKKRQCRVALEMIIKREQPEKKKKRKKKKRPLSRRGERVHMPYLLCMYFIDFREIWHVTCPDGEQVQLQRNSCSQRGNNGEL